MEKSIKAIILAAGRGRRMGRLTDDRPKCLVELKGRALLDWLLESLHAAGIVDIGIVTGYKREMLLRRGMTEFNNPRWAETNMVSSLICAESWLKYETCIVSYSDIFYEPETIQDLKNCNADLAVAYDPNWLTLWTQRFKNPLEDAETFRLVSDGTLAEIGKRPHSIAEIQGQYMGLLRFTPRGWKEVAEVLRGLAASERDNIHMTGLLQKVIEAEGTPISAVRYRGIWGEVDSAEDLAIYHSNNVME